MSALKKEKIRKKERIKKIKKPRSVGVTSRGLDGQTSVILRKHRGE